MSLSILTVALNHEADIVVARQRARRLSELLGFGAQDQSRIATAVSEIARNAWEYGRGGKVHYRIDTDEAQWLTVQVVDEGPGLANADDVLSGAYVSSTGMGVGLVGARRLMDRFHLESRPGAGVTVTLAKRLPALAPTVTPKSLNAIAAALRNDGDGDAAHELTVANQALLASLEDVRARQEELSQLNEELENTNRGVLALYAELEDTAEKLRQASDAKSRFLSHVSHEFRTPLNSILALSRLLLDELDGPLTPEQKRQVGYVRKSAESLTDLVNDLLDIAKVEAGKTELRVTTFDVADMLGALRGVMKPLLTNPDVALVIDAPVAAAPLHTDEGKLAQILRNLVSNALKFTERGEVRVSAAISDDHRSVVFTVRDTGIGIAPQDRARIFEEFEQVSGQLQARAKGTGLGLPLSRRLAELLGGTLGVDSAEGQGSTFTLKIQADLRPSAAPAQRVLVVDDEEAFRYVLRQMIGHKHQVFEADNGAAALESVGRDRPSIMFLDLNMPELDGYDVLSRMSDDPAAEQVKVVVSTSALIDDRDRRRLNRADFVLSKDQLTPETVAVLLSEPGR